MGARASRQRIFVGLLPIVLLGVGIGAIPASADSGGSGPITLSMYCSGPGPGGTVTGGQADTCSVSLAGGFLPAGSVVQITPRSPAFTMVTCSTKPQAVCLFTVTRDLLTHGYIGAETIQFAPQAAGPLTQSASVCLPGCSSPTPAQLAISGPGVQVGGVKPRPRTLPAPPYATKVCTGPNPDGTVSETQVDTCLIYSSGTGGPYIAGDTITIARMSPSDSTVVSCSGSSATIATLATTHNLCAYQVTGTIAGAGQLIGTEVIYIPNTVVPHTPIQQVAMFCSALQPGQTPPRTCDDTGTPIAVTGPGATVIDEIPPTFTSVPADMTVDATGPADTVVRYALPTATDNAPGPIAIACTPESGSAFVVGTTTVTCTATDVSGNTATATFNVTVQNTFDSLCRVTKLAVAKQGIAHSLCVKLEGAAASAARGDVSAMNGKLNAYVNELEAQSGKALTAQQASDLEGLARLLMA